MKFCYIATNITQFHRITRVDKITPPRTNLEGFFLDDGDSETVERRRLWKDRDKISPEPPLWLCVAPLKALFAERFAAHFLAQTWHNHTWAHSVFHSPASPLWQGSLSVLTARISRRQNRPALCTAEITTHYKQLNRSTKQG